MTDDAPVQTAPAAPAAPVFADGRSLRPDSPLARQLAELGGTAPATSPTADASPAPRPNEWMQQNEMSNDPRIGRNSPLSTQLLGAAPDERSPELKAFDQRFGAPATGYDINLGRLDNTDGTMVDPAVQGQFLADTESALQQLGFARSSGNSFVEECMAAGRAYQAMTPNERVEWTLKQAELVDNHPEGKTLMADATKAFARLQEVAPQVANRLSTNGGGMSFMAVVLLAMQQQRSDLRVQIAGVKS
jgi:hypothetical protein